MFLIRLHIEESTLLYLRPYAQVGSITSQGQGVGCNKIALVTDPDDMHRDDFIVAPAYGSQSANHDAQTSGITLPLHGAESPTFLLGLTALACWQL